MDDLVKEPMVNAERVQEALQAVDNGDLSEAAKLLGTMVKSKRLVRASTSSAVSEEIDEVKLWLKKVIADPDADDADSLVARAYYKLRSQMPSDRPGHR
jgi:hypothetical protein